VKVHQDARVYLSSLEPGQSAEHRLGDGRGAYVYLIEGEGTFDDQPVRTGDAATVEGQHLLKITATQPSELILIDVPMVWEPVGVWAR
jgi:redox-sensitive bicupin YhaK (pirin superfamily)